MRDCSYLFVKNFTDSREESVIDGYIGWKNDCPMQAPEIEIKDKRQMRKCCVMCLDVLQMFKGYFNKTFPEQYSKNIITLLEHLSNIVVNNS